MAANQMVGEMHETRRAALPTPDRDEFRMLEALVVEALSAALTTGFCAEHFHGWDICVEVAREAHPVRAAFVIYRDGVLWQSGSAALCTVH